MKDLEPKMKKNINKAMSSLTDKFVTQLLIGSSIMVAISVISLILSNNIF